MHDVPTSTDVPADANARLRMQGRTVWSQLKQRFAGKRAALVGGPSCFVVELFD
jgi:hypothetical protein